MPWLITPGRNFRARQLAAADLFFILQGAHAKLFFFFLLFSAGCSLKTMARSPLFIRNFRCARRWNLYIGTENNQIPIRARAFQIKCAQSFFSKLWGEKERERRAVCVDICASVEIVRAALLRPWIFDYSFRLTKHREPVFEKQSFCLGRRPSQREDSQRNKHYMVGVLALESHGSQQWNCFSFRFSGKCRDRERWTQLIWYCRAVITLRHVTTTAN